MTRRCWTLAVISVAATLRPVDPCRAQRAPSSELQLVDQKVLMEDRDGRLPVDVRWAKIIQLPGGRVLFFDALVPKVWIADGQRRSRQLGREGSGPGEFRMPAFAGAIGDTVWIYDVSLRRFSFFSGESLRLLRSINWSGGTEDGWDLGTPAAINSRGTVLVPGGGDKRIMGNRAVRWVPLFVMGTSPPRKAKPVASLHVLNSSHRVEQPGTRRTVVRDQPFTDKSLFAVSPDGRRLAVITQAEELGRLRDSIVVFNVATSAEFAWSHRLHQPREPFSSRQLQQAIERELSALNEAAQSAGAAPLTRSDYLANLYIPKTRTPATHVMVDNDGAVLIRGNDWLGDSVTYTWYSPTGKELGRLKTPSGLHIRSIQGRRILALRVELDGESTLLSATLAN